MLREKGEDKGRTRRGKREKKQEGNDHLVPVTNVDKEKEERKRGKCLDGKSE